jgi:hypothetical protein
MVTVLPVGNIMQVSETRFSASKLISRKSGCAANKSAARMNAHPELTEQVCTERDRMSFGVRKEYMKFYLPSR